MSQSIVDHREGEDLTKVILNDGYLGMGNQVASFEEEIAFFLGVPEEWVICVNSGTAALHLAVPTSTKPGDEVLIQSLTFVSSF